ncbi:MAG: DUF882 domain-containing protein [Alistipes sp.]|nr:DUF882 domain-containing protein [Alistipes sp.]
MYTPLLETELRRKRLTQHFSYEEMTQTDEREDNTPDVYAFHNLLYLCRILESVRFRFGKPIIITSAFRSPVVNLNAGGSKNSYHMDGRACDISIKHLHPSDVDKLKEILNLYHPLELIHYTTKPIIHVAF